MTEQLRRRIEALTIEYESRREMLVVNHASEIIATSGRKPGMLGNMEVGLSESLSRLGRLQQGYRALGGTDVDALGEDVRQYRAQLKRLGISPAEVYLPINPARAILFLIREMELILMGAPLAVFGFVDHLFPYLAVRGIARRLSVDKDHWATNVIYPSLVIFPLFYFLQIMASWIFLPAMWAAVYTIALPYTGYCAVLYGDRAISAWRRARAFVYFLLHRQTHRDLVDRGRRILGDIYALAGRLQLERKTI